MLMIIIIIYEGGEKNAVGAKIKFGANNYLNAPN
ncbi:hypothetical protein HMPREF0864_04766 [Enterobacteriaceae bacterium 9_2_54FAA]|nr:hypothetical protein HMPREF0864_04766 [Enterobacteriaceae bacterium 9_2_54FAA]